MGDNNLYQHSPRSYRMRDFSYFMEVCLPDPKNGEEKEWHMALGL
jgi:hypothetical protein